MNSIALKYAMFEDASIEVLKRYTCPICQNVLNDPVCDCFSHVFCRSCIFHHIEKSDMCPVTRDHPIKKTQVSKMEVMEQFLLKMIVVCPHKDKGCQFRDVLKNLEAHLLACPYHESEVHLSKRVPFPVKEEEKNLPSFEFEHIDSSKEERNPPEEDINLKVEQFMENHERKAVKKVEKIKCLFADLGCEALIEPQEKVAHFQKNNYEHLFLLTNFINGKFSSLEKKFEGLIRAVEHVNNPYQLPDTSGLLERKKEQPRTSFSLKYVSQGLETRDSLIKCLAAKKPYLFAVFENEILGWFSIKFELLSSPKWVAFGLVDWDTFAENDCSFMTRSNNHGFYIFTSNGFKYNRTETNKAKLKEFPILGKNDILKLEVDNNKKELKLIIGNCKWKIKEVDLSRTLYPCLIMSEEGESLRIISIKQ